MLFLSDFHIFLSAIPIKPTVFNNSVFGQARSGRTKDYKIGICCFSTKQTAVRSKSKDLLARNQNNVS